MATLSLVPSPLLLLLTGLEVSGVEVETVVLETPCAADEVEILVSEEDGVDEKEGGEE